MAHPREAILARIEELAREVPFIKKVYRNVNVFNDDELPYISILEGDEEADDGDHIGKPPTAPRRVHMTPQIVIAAGAVPEEVGADMNALLASLVKSVMSDTTLANLTFNRHRIRYQGFESDLGLGRTMLGQMAVRFTFTYELNPSDL